MATQATTTNVAAPHRYSFLQITTALQTLTIFTQAVSAGLLFTTAYGEVLHDVDAGAVRGVDAVRPRGGAGLEAGRRLAPADLVRDALPGRRLGHGGGDSRTSRRSMSRWAS
ncbi:hypothetical protein SCYAM73S_01370 [Streptomyces cyaneofuscatus]